MVFDSPNQQWLYVLNIKKIIYNINFEFRLNFKLCNRISWY